MYRNTAVLPIFYLTKTHKFQTTPSRDANYKKPGSERQCRQRSLENPVEAEKDAPNSEQGPDARQEN